MQAVAIGLARECWCVRLAKAHVARCMMSIRANDTLQRAGLQSSSPLLVQTSVVPVSLRLPTEVRGRAGRPGRARLPSHRL
eukprot:1013459-Pleurochrysis_carterae.AAC.1